MKKFYFFLVVFFAFMAVSCNTEEKAMVNKDDDLKSELIAQLKDFNSQLEVHPATRFDWCFWGTVAWEDIKGAYRGARFGYRYGKFFGPHGATIGSVACGLVVAAATSYVVSMAVAPPEDGMVIDDRLIDHVYNDHLIMFQYAITVTQDDLLKIKNDANVGVVFPPEYGYLEDIGGLHNGTLDGVLSGTITGTVSANDGDGTHIGGALGDVLGTGTGMVDNDMPDAILIDSTALNIMTSSDFVAEYKAIVYDAIQEAGAGDNINLDELPPIVEDDPIVKEIMELFKEVYMTYPEKADDVDFLINRYIEMIEASDAISDADKEAIYSGFSVAAYSSRYWEAHLNNVTVGQ